LEHFRKQKQFLERVVVQSEVTAGHGLTGSISALGPESRDLGSRRRHPWTNCRRGNYALQLVRSSLRVAIEPLVQTQVVGRHIDRSQSIENNHLRKSAGGNPERV